MKAEDAFDAFLNNNSTITDLKDNVEIGAFTAPTDTSDGKLIINATTDGKYNGNLEVSINAIRQKLSDLNLNTTISGIGNITAEGALQVFIGVNKDKYSDLTDNVTFDENSFTAPNSENAGSLTIKAKPNGKYSGTIDVTINITTNLKEIITIITSFIPYEIKIPAGTTYIQLLGKINADFIKEKLPQWVQPSFITTFYTLSSLTIEDKNKNNINITNEQLSKSGTIKNIDINYNYNNYAGGYVGNRTFLTVIIE